MSGRVVIPIQYGGHDVGQLSIDDSDIADATLYSDLIGAILRKGIVRGATHVNISFGDERVDFHTQARLLVMNYFNERVEKTDPVGVTLENVYVVWFSKTLQNWKALLSTTVPDGMYYEVTHNGSVGETYIDAYKKWDNVAVPLNH